jgi:hypothetical protein
MLLENLRKFIIEWNNLYPIDKWWRNKYNIPFNSEKHLSANQLDIFMEYMENKIYKEYEDSVISDMKKISRFEKEGWISESDIKNNKEDGLFEKIDINIDNINGE